jgi:hypothetical protein
LDAADCSPTDAVPPERQFASAFDEIRDRIMQMDPFNQQEASILVRRERHWVVEAMRGPPNAGVHVRSANQHSPDFRSVTWNDDRYSFTAKQAAIVEHLWSAFGRGVPDVGDGTLLELVDSQGARVSHVFRDHPAWDVMIIPGATRGTRRLAE